MASNPKRKWLTYLLFAAILIGAYFVNVAVQTHLGRRALAQMSLPVHNLDDALLKAGQESKMVLADMSAIWCPSCRQLDKKVFSDSEVVQAINEKYIFARIEYESDEGKAFQKKYSVSGFPTLLILDSQGEKLRQLPVVMDPSTFRANL